MTWQFWWQFVASMAWVRLTLVLCALIFMRNFVRQTISLPFRRFLGDVRRKFMQRLYANLHGTLGSYLRDALQKGNAYVVACLHFPRAWVIFSSFLLFAWWSPLFLAVIFFLITRSTA
jgi:hypothetical protein